MKPVTQAAAILAATLVAWTVWLLLVTARTGGQVYGNGLPYALFPVMLLLGLFVGGLVARTGSGMLVLVMGSALALALLAFDPFYTNAQAALGVQLVALAGLTLHAWRPRSDDEIERAGPQGGTAREPPARTAAASAVLVILVFVTGVFGVLLAARAQAAIVLVVPLSVLVMAAVIRRPAVPRARLLAIGLGSSAVAALSVLALGSAKVWPTWLSHTGSLSGARHRLWGDALALWQEHPLVGAGPGAFLEFSATARSEPHLYAAHSSILQVGAELGTTGVLLFLAILVSGALVASQGDRARALIGVGAWCALAVHSMIDHLYEFPLVVLLAGVVIGWSGARVRAPVAT